MVLYPTCVNLISNEEGFSSVFKNILLGYLYIVSTNLKLNRCLFIHSRWE